MGRKNLAAGTGGRYIRQDHNKMEQGGAAPGRIGEQAPPARRTEGNGMSSDLPREQAISSLQAVFRPRSIAVVGVSRTPGTPGYQVLDNLLRHGFTGVVYPVNPNARVVHSIPCYATVADIPEPVDLAVVAVPKERVLDVVDECGAKGVRAVVVITAGFKEVGGEGLERERALLEKARGYGMRLVGPNCLGVLNTDPAVSMNATFAPTMPPAGPVSFMSQSGTIGITILDYAAEYGIGIRNFISVGNKPDVSGNDVMEYWAEEEGSRVILMYLENFGNPRKFVNLARRVTREKPVIAVKSGRTTAGVRAVSSHTGVLASQDVAVDALFAQCGVIRVDTVEELFDLAMAFGHLPVPAGNRVGIVTNAGGPGIIIADACESEGLEVPELTPATQSRLRGVLAAEASVSNPVDMIATATAQHYESALGIVLEDPNIDAVIAAFVPPLGVRQVDVASAIVAARRANPEKPLLAVLMGREGLPQGRAALQRAGVPAYIFPESASRALAAMDRYRRWQQRPVGTIRTFEADREGAAERLAEVAAEGRELVTGPEALAVLRAYGIPTARYQVAQNAVEAARVAREVGFPVVLKVLSPDIPYKRDLGGVVLDLRTPSEVSQAYESMMERVRAAQPYARIEGVMVQQYVKGGRETIVGSIADPGFGSLVMFGLGGPYVEALGDVAFRVAPVTDVDAHEMVRSLRGYPLLRGVRNGTPADLELIVEVLQRVSQLASENENLLELDIHPFVVHERDGVALDAHIRVGSARRRDLATPRHTVGRPVRR